MKESPIDLDAYPPFDGFPPEGLKFLRQLKTHNTREWFGAHRDEYMEFVKLPMESLIAALAYRPGIRAGRSNGACASRTRTIFRAAVWG